LHSFFCLAWVRLRSCGEPAWTLGVAGHHSKKAEREELPILD
jgi:hypothetical protein